LYLPGVEIPAVESVNDPAPIIDQVFFLRHRRRFVDRGAPPAGREIPESAEAHCGRPV